MFVIDAIAPLVCEHIGFVAVGVSSSDHIRQVPGIDQLVTTFGWSKKRSLVSLPSRQARAVTCVFLIRVPAALG